MTCPACTGEDVPSSCPKAGNQKKIHEKYGLLLTNSKKKSLLQENDIYIIKKCYISIYYLP